MRFSLLLICLLLAVSAEAASTKKRRPRLHFKKDVSEAAKRLRSMRQKLARAKAASKGGKGGVQAAAAVNSFDSSSTSFTSTTNYGGSTSSSLDAAPACNLASVDPVPVQPTCEGNAQAVLDPDTSVYRCMALCSTLNSRTSGLQYQASADGMSCVPVCPNGQIVASSDSDSVTCVTCPLGYVYIKEKKMCFEKCGTGAMAALPVAYDGVNPAGVPRCSATCPRLFPRQKSFDRCANTAGRTTPRANAVRRSTAPRKRELQTVPRPEADLSCPRGSSRMEDDYGVTSCYKCSPGTALTQDGMGFAKCATDTCAPGYNRCGIYCWHDMLSDGIGFWEEDYCAAFLDTVSACMPDCDALGLDGKKK